MDKIERLVQRKLKERERNKKAEQRHMALFTKELDRLVKKQFVLQFGSGLYKRMDHGGVVAGENEYVLFPQLPPSGLEYLRSANNGYRTVNWNMFSPCEDCGTLTTYGDLVSDLDTMAECIADARKEESRFLCGQCARKSRFAKSLESLSILVSGDNKEKCEDEQQ